MPGLWGPTAPPPLSTRFWRRGFPAAIAPERSHARLEIEAELNGVGAGWTDLTADWKRDPATTVDYGITGAGPLDLVASTGTMSFTLDNGPRNSAGLVGYYSPGHPSCRPGFKLGIAVRFRYLLNGTTYFKFYGWLDTIDPQAGQYLERKTVCSAVDWMDIAAASNPIVATQSSKRADEVLNVLVPAVARQPAGKSYQTGDSTFLFSLDNSQNESQVVLTELQRIAQSEYGHIYMKADTVTGGVLTLEKRTARFGSPTIAATFSDSMVKLTVPQSRSQIKNRVKTTVHPRRVGAVTTAVLYSLPTTGSVQSVPAGATVKITGSYISPTIPNARVGGTDMTTPVATTDYTMNTASNGSGSDLTASFVVTALFGANSVEFTISNNSSSLGYITLLQVRGREIDDYDPVDTVAIDTASITAYGETRVTLDMPYQSDTSVAAQVGAYILAAWSRPVANEVMVGFMAPTDTELAIALPIEPGSAIVIAETVSGLHSTYYVNHVSVRCITDKILYFEWVCQLAVALPVVASRITSNVGSDQLSHTVSMPSGINSGDLLVSVFTARGNPTITWPAGWTEFVTLPSVSLTGKTSIAYRKSDGTEGASITVTIDVAAESSHVTLRIVGADDPAVRPPEGMSSTGNPVVSYPCPTITPVGGTKNYLFLAVGAFNGSINLTSIPAGYSNTSAQGPNVNGYATVVSERNLSASTETPGPYVRSVGTGWITFTVAVHPARL